MSRVGMAHPDFFQGGRLPTLPPRAGAHAQHLTFLLFYMVKVHRNDDLGLMHQNHLAAWFFRTTCMDEVKGIVLQCCGRVYHTHHDINAIGKLVTTCEFEIDSQLCLLLCWRI